MRRVGRHFAIAAAAAVLLGPIADATRAAPGSLPLVPAASSAAFHTFVDAFRTDAAARGITAATYDAAFAGLEPDTSLAALIRRQPEFAKPIGAYLATQVTMARVAAGRAQRDRWRADLDAIESRTGVPGSIVVAVWGLETNYGAAAGNKDVIRSLATLAALNYRPALYRDELLAALSLLQKGEVDRAALRGSWAGAMGQPQFMPSSFEKFAVDADGDGRRDIWTSVPDALASIANFIRAQGWTPGAPWGFEVRVPAGFDDRFSRGSAADFAARGIARADGGPLPARGAFILFFPAGAAGPAFLVTENFAVLKTYNFSDAYVLSIAQLADRMDGGGPIRAPWPTEPSMTREARIMLQARLAALGYPVDNREGRISFALRDVIRTAQSSVGLTPDGNPTAALLRALEKR